MKVRLFKLVFIDLPITLFVLLFSVLAVKFLPASTSQSNLLFDFITAQLSYYLFPLILFFFFIMLFLINGAKKYTNLFKPTFRYAFGLLFIALISLPLSFAAVYVYAFVQINSHILSYNADPSSIVTSPQAVADAIAATDQLEIVPISEAEYKKDLLLLLIKKKKGFYEERILPSFPMALYKRSYLPPTTLAFTNNYLAFSELTPDTLTIISPALGKFLIEHSLERSIIKSLPDTRILEKENYITFRKHTIQQQVGQLDTVVDTIDTSILSVNDYIASNEASIAKNREILAKAEEQKQKAKCKTPEKCAVVQARWDKVKTQAQNNIAKAQTALDKNTTVLGTTTKNKEKVLGVKAVTEAKKGVTAYELGLFTPPNTITMTIVNADDPKAFDAYLHTLIHEYFHYLSYIDDQTKLDHFFEEGLTEYFARMAYENYTGKKMELGYQVDVMIIKAMTKKIPERELLAIYYEKDQNKLEALLNKTYGKDFYSTNTEAFSVLNSLPTKESLEIANLIMKQVGGNQLTIIQPTKKDQFTLPAPDEMLPIEEQSTAILP